MTAEPTTAAKLRGLRWSIALNASNTVFTQFTFFGSAFVLFLDRLGLSKSDIGFILSLIPFSGLIAPFVAPTIARFGYKRTFVLFYFLRKIMAVPLLLTPWVVYTFGGEAALAFIAMVVGLFSLSRSVEETAYYPWNQEFIPAAVRGKYGATRNIFTALVGVISVSIAGIVIGYSTGLVGFMALIVAGVIFGLISAWCALFIPGGAPVRHAADAAKPQRNLAEALRDPNFLRYLAGLALITLGTTPIASFLPLFLQEQVGLTAGNVVWVQNGTLLGAMVSSYLWGWATDRYGSRPVMLSGVLMFVMIPLLWWIMPRHTALSLYLALAIAFGQGVANLGWGIGATKLLFVSVVPVSKKMDYLALWFAWAGITAGTSQVVGGWVLDYGRKLSGNFYGLPLNPYVPLLAIGIVAPFLSLWLLRAIRDDSRVSMGQFAGIFLRGNPVLAMSSLVRYYMARDEHTTVLTTARLGQANSLLAVDELLEALDDPRFNVRFEAILAIARMKPDARLIAALGEILAGNNPSLSVIAAWALGRIGDEEALDPLRQGLDARYRSIQAHSARALGVLGDIGVIPKLLKRLKQEQDDGLRVAYASALGSLRASSATEILLEQLQTADDQHTRMELALALARIIGNEQHFIQLWRQLRNEPGTSAAQAVTAFKRHLSKVHAAPPTFGGLVDQCAEALARDDLAAGVARLVEVIAQLMPELRADASAQVLTVCQQQLRNGELARQEYLLLALHALEFYFLHL
jgi:MFS family permease